MKELEKKMLAYLFLVHSLFTIFTSIFPILWENIKPKEQQKIIRGLRKENDKKDNLFR